MSPATGLLRFKQLKQKAYADIWDTIADQIESCERDGDKSVSVRGFPPYTMTLMADDFMSAGYDVTVEIGEFSNSVSLYIAWG